RARSASRHPDGASVVLRPRDRDDPPRHHLRRHRGLPRRDRLRHDAGTRGGDDISSLRRGAAALAAFVILTIVVALGTLRSVDRAILDFLQQSHPSWLDLAASVVTLFGQSEVVGAVALGVSLVRLRHGRHDWWVPLLLGVGVAAELVLKLVIPQAAPPSELARSVPLLPFLEAPTPFSFPSGHVARVAFL